MTRLSEQVQDVISTWPKPGGYWVALSGGCDSIVLLHALYKIRTRLPAPLHAVHVHHGLSPDAEHWTKHCLTVTDHLVVPCDVLRVDARPCPGESPEAKARQVRYDALSRHLPAGAMLLTAHHRDDQVETVLLQLLRGAGLAGLSGMAALAEREYGWLGRPLLDLSRSDIHAYAKRNALVWVEDPSNTDESFDRNFLRLQVIPLLRRRWPGLGQALGRSAAHCAAGERLSAAVGRRLLGQLVGDDPYRMPVAGLLQQSPVLQAVLLRQWLTALGLPVPDANRLRRLVSEIAIADASAMPQVNWPGAEVRRYRGDLYAMPPLPEEPSDRRLTWPKGVRELALPNGLGELVLGGAGLALAAEAIDGRDLSVGFRRAGLAATPAGRAGRRSFKRICQDWGIPPWLRRRIPLLYVDDQLAAIGDRVVCEPFGVRRHQPVVHLQWCRPAYFGPWP